MGAPPYLSANFNGSDKISWDKLFSVDTGHRARFSAGYIKVTIKAPYKNNKRVLLTGVEKLPGNIRAKCVK